MVDRITEISFDRPITESDGTLTLQSRTYFKTLTNQALVIGTGTPESIVEAEIGAQYMDDTGIAGAILYIKRDDNIGGDKSQGWILV